MKTLLIALLFLPTIAAASETWQSGTYTYDGAGNIIGIGNDSYVYDPVGRLSHTVANAANESYVYDAFGNLLTKTTEGRPETLEPVSSSTNRVTTASYDAAGNMTAIGERAYVYDPLNMMVRIDTDYARKRYIYTADDERIGVQTDETFTRWTVRDFGGKVLREFRADGLNTWSWTEDYLYRDGQLVAAEQPGTPGGLRHFSLDHLGTTRLITNTPAPGETPVAYGRHDFFPFGMEQTPTNQEVVNHSSERPEAMKFTGHQRDFLGDWFTDNSDYLDYMHARYYTPVGGRFLSVDPISDSVHLSSPQSWNRYVYAMNNPMINADPDGRCTMTTTDGTVHTDDSTMCVEVNATAPHWSPEELRARADAAVEHEKEDFLASTKKSILAKNWGSLKLTAAKGRGGALTFGQKDGQTFVQAQAGLGYGGGIKWDPAGRLPTPDDGSTPPRAFLGFSVTGSLSLGPLSLDLPMRTGLVVYEGSDNKLHVDSHSSWKPKFTFKWKQGIGLGASAMASGDVGTTFDIFD